MWTFFEWMDSRNQREFTAWRLKLQPVERAVLDEKMRAIEQFGLNVSCLKGPLKGYRHLYKIRAQCPDRALRPILCRGPVDMNSEFTLLKGAFEVGDAWQPSGARAEAESRRLAIIENPSRRVRYEVPRP